MPLIFSEIMVTISNLCTSETELPSDAKQKKMQWIVCALYNS